VLLARLRFPNGSDFMTAGAVNEHRFYLRCLFAPASIYDAPPQDYSIDNLVYPLQYEPEASLLYFAPHHVDQVSFVETVLRALPHGKVLWVKEHPNQFGALNEKTWRNLKKRYENLRFVHGRKNGRELIKNSAMVVTISSTMGLDGLLLGRTVLVGGDVFYSGFKGAVRTESYQDLAKELNEQDNYNYSDNFNQNIKELIEFGESVYAGDPQPSDKLFSEINLNLLCNALSSELQIQ
jgi:capsule polysaccharide export protein KpsC/LpsZ